MSEWNEWINPSICYSFKLHNIYKLESSTQWQHPLWKVRCPRPLTFWPQNVFSSSLSEDAPDKSSWKIHQWILELSQKNVVSYTRMDRGTDKDVKNVPAATKNTHWCYMVLLTHNYLQEQLTTDQKMTPLTQALNRLIILEGAQRVHISAKWILQLFYLFITVR